MTAPNFYQAVAPMTTTAAVFEPERYVRAPDDWLVALGDIEGSTAAVEAGRHSAVNYVAASLVTALTNLCGPIPFQFGGDGAVALVPPELAAQARRELARNRGFAARDCGLRLRVGLVSVAQLTARGADLLVGRYEPTPGNAQAQFLGSAIALLERAIKERGDPALARLAAVGEAEDDGELPDLTGLSCRWDPIRPRRGKMLSLVIQGAPHGAMHATLLRLAGLDSLRVAELASLDVHWPPRNLWLEARARRGRAPLLLSAARVLAESLASTLLFRWKLRLGRFDPERYRREMLANLFDFSRSGETFSLVFDCPEERIAVIRRTLEAEAADGALRFGMHVSDYAVVTCLVNSASEGLHVHFADGGDGGYTRAASELKAQNAAAQAAVGSPDRPLAMAAIDRPAIHRSKSPAGNGPL